MSLTPGTKLGPYEVLSPLGAGGMGEVYRARDTRLGRDVAVKVLPQHLSANSEVRARFEREAKTVSSLNHPHICTLFDVGREGDTDYLVMELVEGETLAARLTKGPLSVAETLRIGSQVADALDRAHRAGVVHRDLKPGNIMLTKSGAKLMDFGLARATGMGGAASGSGVTIAALSQSPTIAQPLTAEGTIVGTFQYMSPEQLEGQETDARGDIWAFGCVLYEMATGKRAFEGKSQASLIGSIMNADPTPISQIAPMTPPALERLVRACLTKDPGERVQTAHDVKLQLQWIAEGGSQTGMPALVSGGRHARARLWIAWAVAMIAILAGAAGITWLWPRAHAPMPDYRFRSEAIPGIRDYSWPRVSPDGHYMTVLAEDSTGSRQVWLRPMDQTVSRPILGSQGVVRAYWSPDNREIAFVADGKIKRLAITGGTPTVVCETRGGSDLSWGAGGFILMDGRFSDSLLVVPARGGELRPATRIYRADGEIGSAWPCFLPDGKRFLFIGNRSNAGGTADIRLGRLGSLDSKLLGKSDGRVEYAPGDWVLYLKGTTLLAQKLDTKTETLTGEALTIAENVRTGTSSGHFSISTTGVLAYARGDETSIMTLRQTERNGRPVGEALTKGMMANPSIPADAGRVLFERKDSAASGSQIVVRDLARGTETKLTLDGNAASTPVWSPDGRRFACVVSGDEGKTSLLVASSDGLGARDKIALPGSGAWILTQWSPALRRLIATPPSFHGAFAANPDSVTVAPRIIPGLKLLLGHTTISPDGRWAAYVTNEGGGSPQVYVQSLTGTPGRWQISTDFGIWPQWTKGGTEIVYEGLPNLMAVSIDTREGFHPGTPRTLFPCPVRGDALTHYWACTPDGERFFVLQSPRTVASGIVEVVTDFASLVNRR